MKEYQQSCPLRCHWILELAVEIDVIIELISNNYNAKKSLRNNIYNLLHEFKNN